MSPVSCRGPERSQLLPRFEELYPLLFDAPPAVLSNDTLRSAVDFLFHSTVALSDLPELQVVLNTAVDSYPAPEDLTEAQDIEQRQVQACIDALGMMQMSLDTMSAPRGPSSTPIATIQSFISFVQQLQTALLVLTPAQLPGTPVDNVLVHLDRVMWTAGAAWAAGAVMSIARDLPTMWQTANAELSAFVDAVIDRLKDIWYKYVPACACRAAVVT